ncbi:MAG: hypothetical protein ABW186_01370, partial [Rhodanobacteraceae bacterium]
MKTLYRISLCIALAATSTAGAQTLWTGTTGDWFTGTNWSADVPGPAGDAEINNNGTATIAAGGAVAHSVMVGFAVGDDGHIAATGAGTLDVEADLAIGYGGDGTLAVSNGAVVSDYSGEIGYTIDSTSGAHGSATVDGAGSAWHHTFELYVGYGNGTLDITNGGTVTDFFGYIAYFPEFPGRSSGTVNVDGAGSSWTSDSTLHVGDSGDGVLNVTNGGAVVNGEGYLGFDFGSMGAASIDGEGSSWTNFGFFYVGDGGDGTLDVTDGGAVDSFGSFSYIAYAAASTSIATIDGAGSRWTNGNGFYVGFDGDGTLAITNGGVFSNGFFANVGFSPGSTGTVAITGAGSLFDNAGVLSIGGNVSSSGGTGMLRIADDGEADASTVNIWNTATLEIGSGGAIATPMLMIDGALNLTGGTAALDGAMSMTPLAATRVAMTAGNESHFEITGATSLAGELTVDVAGAAAGTYAIVTSAGGLGTSTFANVVTDPADSAFTATLSYDANTAWLTLESTQTVADVSVAIAADREFASEGDAIAYTITLQNAGPGTATDVSIASTLSPLLDASSATWQCIDGSGCAPSGTGELADTIATLAPGATVTWVLVAHVREDAGDGVIDTSVHAAAAGDPDSTNDTASA